MKTVDGVPQFEPGEITGQINDFGVVDYANTKIRLYLSERKCVECISSFFNLSNIPAGHFCCIRTNTMLKDDPQQFSCAAFKAKP